MRWWQRITALTRGRSPTTSSHASSNPSRLPEDIRVAVGRALQQHQSSTAPTDTSDGLNDATVFIWTLDDEFVLAADESSATLEADAHAERGECSYAGGFYALALRSLATREEAEAVPGERRLRRIALRLRLADAAHGAKAWRESAGAYAAAMREIGLIAKKKKRVRVDEDEEEDSEMSDSEDEERRRESARPPPDAAETPETYEDGGDEERATDDMATTIAEFIKRCNDPKSKASVKGLINAETLYKMGDACHRAGRYKRSVLVYIAAMQLEPDGPKRKSVTQVHLACGEMFLDLEMPQRALEYFRLVLHKPLEVSMSVGDVLMEISECYVLMDMDDEAKRCIKQVRLGKENAPIRTRNVVKLAWRTFEEDKDGEKALNTLEEANELNETSEGLYTLGRVHMRLRQFDEADECFLRACEMDPTSPKIWLEIGVLYLKGHRIPEIALKAFTRAKELAKVLQLKEDALRADRGYGFASEGKATCNPEEVTVVREEATLGRGDTYSDLGAPSKALREYEELPESSRIAIRKLRITTWAVILVQRAFRKHVERKMGEAIRGQRRPVVRSPLQFVASDEPKPQMDKLNFTAKDGKKKEAKATRKYGLRGKTKEEFSERPVMDLLKDFTIKGTHMKPEIRESLENRGKGGGFFGSSQTKAGKRSTAFPTAKKGLLR